MDDNPIDAIRKAELETNEILNDAAKEVDRIKENAALEAGRIVNDAEAAAKANAERLIAAAREKGMLISQKAEAAQVEELHALRLRAAQKREQAIAVIIASLV